jgi:hypothetical protein
MSMATDTNTNNGSEAGIESPLGPITTGDDTTSDPVLSKHLDMAIEAQDGKKTDATTEGATPKEPTNEPAKGSEAAKSDSTSSTKDSTAQPKPDEKGKETKGNTGGPKDLVLKGQGPDGTDLVIKSGPERRFYEQLQTARQRTEHLNNEIKTRDTRINELTTKMQTLEGSVAAVNGMPPQQLATAARLFTDLQRDPSGTLKKLLAEAVALGHTVEGIGQGVDVAAITATLRNELAAKDTAREPTEQEINASVEKDINNFYSRFPDARTHDALLGAVIRDHPDLSLEAAYFQLKDAFAEKGFDWTRTIEDNVRDSTAQVTTDTTPNNGAPSKPLPNGGNTPNGNEPIEKHDHVVMSENADMGDIVRAAMRENGLNV